MPSDSRELVGDPLERFGTAPGRTEEVEQKEQHEQPDQDLDDDDYVLHEAGRLYLLCRDVKASLTGQSG